MVREGRYATEVTASGSLGSLSLPGRGVGVLPSREPSFTSIQVGLSVLETFSLILFDLLASIAIRLYYIVLPCIPIS